MDLLHYYLVTAALTLPPAVAEASPASCLEVAIDREGGIALGGRPVSPAELARHVADWVKATGSSEARVSVYAGEAGPLVATVEATLRAGGIQQISLQSR